MSWSCPDKSYFFIIISSIKKSFNKDFLYILYGSKYLLASKTAQILSFLLISESISTPVAQILKAMGKKVSGSDTKEVFFTDKVLRKCGIEFAENFNPRNLPDDIDLVIHSSAFNKENNVEMAAVIKRGIPRVTQAEALAGLFNFKKGIAVCGSHGKTTTSALLGFVLNEAGLKPTVETGSSVPQFKGNAITGKGTVMVIEADEYQNKLRLYRPYGVLLNNIDYDHPDFFQTPTAYQSVFRSFAQRVPKHGFIVANMDDKNVVKAVKNCKCRIISYPCIWILITLNALNPVKHN